MTATETSSSTTGTFPPPPRVHRMSPLPPAGRPRSARSVVRPAFLLLLLLFLGRPAVLSAASPSETPLPPGSPPSVAAGERERLTVKAIFGEPGLLGERPADVQWSPDGRHVSFLETADDSTRIIAVDTTTGRRSVLLDSGSFRTSGAEGNADGPLEPVGHQWSPDGRRLLLETGDGLFLFSPAAASLERVTGSGRQAADPQFSPSGAHLAYVLDGDLYAREVVSGRVIRLTDDGGGAVLNGTADWVYAEELDMDAGYAWSPAGDRIAFLRFDQSPVTRWPLMRYLTPSPAPDERFFPRPGEPNADVRIGVASLEDGNVRWIDPGEGPGGDYYVARLQWMPDGRRLAVQLLGRDQSRLDLLAVPADGSGRPEVLLQERNSCWVNVTDDLLFLDDDTWLWTSERDGWRHIYRFEPGASSPVQLTRGPWQVTELHAADRAAGFVYFTATEKSPRERHLYRVGLDGTGLRRLTGEDGTHTVHFSPEGQFYIDEHSSAVRPTRVTLHLADGSRVALLAGRQEETLAQYGLTPPRYLTVTADDGTALPATLIVPPDFDPTRRYPVLVYVYGGPGAQVVRDLLRGVTDLWYQMLAAEGFLVFRLDNRGAFGYGADWERAVNRRLGQLELADQLAGVRHLRSLPYVDPGRIGIFGWSYGGYMVLNAMLRAPGRFAAGAAVAPVSDWLEYDTIYTERYMGLPDENESGYREGSPVHFAEGLEGRLLLVHGTSDDNVHFRHTARMLAALVEAGRPYELLIYPGKAHGIRGAAARVHLFERLTRFFTETLAPGGGAGAGDETSGGGKSAPDP